MSRSTEFDREEIILKAMNLFWKKGYEGTSLKDLTNETGLLKGSLYNSFKSKENLFLLCLDRYGQHSRSFFYKEGDPDLYLKNFFQRLVDEGVKKENTKGCLIMNSCIELADTNSAPAVKTKNLFTAVELNFENVLKQYENISKPERDKLKTNFISAAFSIREISKFRKEKKFLRQIANNALKDVGLKI